MRVNRAALVCGGVRRSFCSFTVRRAFAAEPESRVACLWRRVLSHADGPSGFLATDEQQVSYAPDPSRNRSLCHENVVEQKAKDAKPEFRRLWNLPDDRPYS